MKKYVYSQYDRVSNLHVIVFFSADDKENVEASLRAAANKGQIDHSQDDIEIMYLGTFENKRGEFELLDRPEFVAGYARLAEISDLAKARMKGEDHAREEAGTEEATDDR